MRGLWLEAGKLVYREDLPMPEPEAGEALVRVRLAGICGTDLELMRGYYPFCGILGHEFVGEVVASPDPDWEGRRVVGEINLVCRRCRMCRQSLEHHCENRRVLGIRDKDGAFAEFLTLPLSNLHAVPNDLPDEKAVLVEPLAAALEILEQCPIRPSDRVLVVGAGRLGQLIARVFRLTGVDLAAVVRHERQKRLLERLQIQTLAESEVAERSYDIVVEASGSPAGFELARRALCPCGTLVLKSTYVESLKIDLSRIVVDEQRLVGSRCGPFAPALRLLERGLIDPTDLIEAIYPLEEGMQAFAYAGQRGIFKVLLRP